MATDLLLLHTVLSLKLTKVSPSAHEQEKVIDSCRSLDGESKQKLEQREPSHGLVSGRDRQKQLFSW